MKKIINIILKLTIVMTIVFSGVVNVEAKEYDNEQKNLNHSEVTDRSGGFVKSKKTVQSCTLASTKVKYTDLVDSWAKTSTYTVKKVVTVSSSNTLSIGVDATIKEQLNSKFNISYGSSVSTSTEIGRTIPADKNRYSKLRHEVQVKTYNIKVHIIDTYYDTSLGYYDRAYTYSGTISIPNKNESYIKVYYK